MVLSAICDWIKGVLSWLLAIDGHDLLTTFLGAFLGFLVAIYLNRLSEKTEKWKEGKRKENYNIDMLNILNIYVDSALDDAKQQIRYLEQFVQWVNNEPLKGHMPVILAAYNIERLKNFNSNALLEAFLYFHPNNPSIINSYDSIFSSTDYLYRSFKEIEERIRIYQNDIVNHQHILTSCFQNVLWQIQMRQKSIMVDNPGFYIEDEEYCKIQDSIVDFADLTNDDNSINLKQIEYLRSVRDTLCDKIKNVDIRAKIFIEANTGLYEIDNINMRSTEIVRYLSIFFGTLKLGDILKAFEDSKIRLKK
jgi:hypothetical protein